MKCGFSTLVNVLRADEDVRSGAPALDQMDAPIIAELARLVNEAATRADEEKRERQARRARATLVAARRPYEFD